MRGKDTEPFALAKCCLLSSSAQITVKHPPQHCSQPVKCPLSPQQSAVKGSNPATAPRHVEGEGPNTRSTSSLGGAGPGMPGAPVPDSVQTFTTALPGPSWLGSHCKCHLCTLVLEQEQTRRNVWFKGKSDCSGLV